jgi:hypothetical protein
VKKKKENNSKEKLQKKVEKRKKEEMEKIKVIRGRTYRRKGEKMIVSCAVSVQVS